jgi:hypothetical protein
MRHLQNLDIGSPINVPKYLWATNHKPGTGSFIWHVQQQPNNNTDRVGN